MHCKSSKLQRVTILLRERSGKHFPSVSLRLTTDNTLVLAEQTEWFWRCCVHSEVQLLKLALSKGPNRIGVFSSQLRTERDPVSETSYFLVFRIPDDGQGPETQWLRKSLGGGVYCCKNVIHTSLNILGVFGLAFSRSARRKSTSKLVPTPQFWEPLLWRTRPEYVPLTEEPQSCSWLTNIRSDSRWIFLDRR
jgi:hypothetical protein